MRNSLSGDESLRNGSKEGSKRSSVQKRVSVEFQLEEERIEKSASKEKVSVQKVWLSDEDDQIDYLQMAPGAPYENSTLALDFLCPDVISHTENQIRVMKPMKTEGVAGHHANVARSLGLSWAGAEPEEEAMSAVLKEGTGGTDITIVAGRTQVSVRRSVLAVRCPHLQAKLDMPRSKNTIHLPDWVQPAALHSTLKYIYTEDMAHIDDNVTATVAVLRCADLLHLRRLVSHCMRILLAKPSPEAAIEILSGCYAHLVALTEKSVEISEVQFGDEMWANLWRRSWDGSATSLAPPHTAVLRQLQSVTDGRLLEALLEMAHLYRAAPDAVDDFAEAVGRWCLKHRASPTAFTKAMGGAIPPELG